MNTTVRYGFVKVGVVAVLISVLGAVGYWLLWDRIFPPEIEPYSAVFVISPGPNVRPLNFDAPEIRERIDRVISTYGFTAIIVSDGNPANQTSTFDFSVFKPDTADRVINNQAINENVNRLQQLFLDELQNARHLEPERDVLEAISLGARILASRPSDEIREIVVLSSGLSTSGFLNFADQNEWLYSDATVIIDILQSNRSLPNLEEIIVSWAHIYDVDSVIQAVIPGSQRENLKATWRLIVESSGGEFNILSAHPREGRYEGPPVTPVKIRPTFTLQVSPSTADVQRGTSFDFSAHVVGDGISAQDIDWAIEGPAHPGTFIDDGRLVVAPDDPRENIILIAISTQDRSVTGQATVRLREEALPPSVVREVRIFPDDVIMGTFPPYNTLEISTTVEGENNPSQEVRFELFGNSDPTTRVDPDGRIFIGQGEIGQGETEIVITIRAISVENPTIYAEIPVRIFTEPPGVVEVMFLGNSDAFVNRAQARSAIAEWVDFINSQNSGVVLFGCTANTGIGNSDGVALGTARAQAVKDLFVREFNVDPNKIAIRGLGHNNIWNRPNGISGTPSWDEAAAATNRKVVIMSADDPDAQRIYDGTLR